ncbi:hypothetical protein DFS34DRAFT_639668 [Phlyctochytrium arcticum]|nr:hypothetical protein DFS34DRAFT_639668 [Phlyctochytrium arcticum]
MAELATPITEKVWYQLVDASGDAVPGVSVADVNLDINADITDLKLAVKKQSPKRLDAVSPKRLLVYASKADVIAKCALGVGKTVGTLQTTREAPLMIVVREHVLAATSETPTISPQPEAATPTISPQPEPFLPRVELVDKLCGLLKYYDIVPVFSQVRAGKKSLFHLLSRRMSNCIYVSCLWGTFDFQNFLKNLAQNKVIDSNNREHSFGPNNPCIIWMDDAQAQYRDSQSWTALFERQMSQSMGAKVVISATNLRENSQLIPPELRSYSRIGPDDFRLSFDEARLLLRAPAPVGLRVDRQSVILEQVIINACNGLIGALRGSIDALAGCGRNHGQLPSETKLLQSFFSQNLTGALDRCFGGNHIPPVNEALEAFLVQCFLHLPEGVQKPALDVSAEAHLNILVEAGVLVELATGHVAFSSPLAKRHYSKWLYPNRWM